MYAAWSAVMILYVYFASMLNVARQGGEVARNARLELEQKMGQKVVTPLNSKSIQKSIEDKNESE